MVLRGCQLIGKAVGSVLRFLSKFLDYIDIDDLGLNDDDALEALPLMDAILREEFTAVEDGSTIEDRPKIPTPLSIKAKGGLIALEFEHVAELPKYPRSHEQGYAYLIDLKGIPEDKISNRVNSIVHYETYIGEI
ncbi:hypothetical protein N7495_007789 [Penicillium taxi]|uniref:uncharacterized protein n=1 Tax=Penicillium taxi TaxID=168475 RepID=UPI0025453BEE|nr:uncharacterized protein N7495_007789 [Penicillium taxi]KAJ5887748.1 hypothetical protein N7495_007789 [Penicillium taxi]